MVFNSSSGGLRVPGRRYSVVGRPTGPLDDGADSDGQPCGARSRRSRAMAATGAGAWIHGLMVLWFHGSCRDEEHEEQPSGAPAPARRRGATARDADSAPWLPLAPARSATRSSLRAPRSEDAARAAFERSRGEGAARAAFGRPPRRSPFSCPLWLISHGSFHWHLHGATRSSLRAPRSEDAVRAAFERSRGEGAARAAFGRPRRPPFSCPLWFISIPFRSGAPACANASFRGAPEAATGRQRPRRTRPSLSRCHPAHGA